MGSAVDGSVSGTVVRPPEAQANAIMPARLADALSIPARPARAGGRPMRRLSLITVVGTAALALANAFAPRDAAPVVEVNDVPRPRPSSAPAAAAPAPALKRLLRARIEIAAGTDPFIGASFVLPPPPPVVAPPPPPPPPPKAPPLPFAFVGLLERGAGKPAAFISRGDALLVVSVGDVIENDYRVESLSPAAIVLTYLPLNERQLLSATGAQP